MWNHFRRSKFARMGAAVDKLAEYIAADHSRCQQKRNLKFVPSFLPDSVVVFALRKC